MDLGSPGSWDDHNIDVGSIIFDGENYHLWYGGSRANLNINTGYATSPDGINWTKYANNPVLGLGSWDSPRVHQARVIFSGNNYHMFYGGGGYFTWRIGYASSTDGINWNKYDNNPVLDVGDSGSWEDYYVAVPSVILDTVNSIYRMWYTGGREALTGSVGYATAPDTITGIFGELSSEIPRKFVLMQNYPNPFNPRTVICYQLPVVSEVELSIYNILGQKVATLVSEKQPAGTYKMEWDASGFASGLYFYRLETDKGFVQSRKLILLK